MSQDSKIGQKSSKAQHIVKAMLAELDQEDDRTEELCERIERVYEEEYALTHVKLPADKAGIAIRVGDTVCWNDGTSMNVVAMEWCGNDFWSISGTDANGIEVVSNEPESSIHVQDGTSVLDYIADTRELLESDSFLSDAEYARKYGLFLADDEIELRKAVNDHRIARAFSLME